MRLTHPALPNPTKYFEGQEKTQLRERLLRIAFGAGLLCLIGIVFFLFGVVIFSAMPE